MKEDKTSRTKVVRARITPGEWERLQKAFQQTTYKKLSDFVRKKLFDKPVAIYQRNQSLDDFVGELVLLKNELNAIGNNYNQVVKRLHSMYDYTEVKIWLKLHDSTWQLMQKKVDEIKSKINQIDDLWLR
jgi:chromosome condensin MukBEF complex kleisin-like MukF subunit